MGVDLQTFYQSLHDMKIEPPWSFTTDEKGVGGKVSNR